MIKCKQQSVIFKSKASKLRIMFLIIWKDRVKLLLQGKIFLIKKTGNLKNNS